MRALFKSLLLAVLTAFAPVVFATSCPTGSTAPTSWYDGSYTLHSSTWTAGQIDLYVGTANANGGLTLDVFAMDINCMLSDLYSLTTSVSGVTKLSSSQISGVIPTANLGTGTASSTTWLRGDGTWQSNSGSGGSSPGGTTNSIQTNAGGTTFGGGTYALLNTSTYAMTLGGGGTAGSITPGSASSATSAGTALTIQGGPGGSTSGNGGALNLYSGTATSGYTGTVNIASANGTSGGSGAVNITTGNAAGSAGNAGALNFATGNGYLAGQGGTYQVALGNGGATGPGGSFVLTAGNGGGTSGGGGNINFTAGSSGTSGTGGGITFSAGSGSGSTNTGGGFYVYLATGGTSTTNAYDGEFVVTPGQLAGAFVVDANANALVGNYASPGNPAGIGGNGALAIQSHFNVAPSTTATTSTTIPAYTGVLLIDGTGATTYANTFKLPANPVDGEILDVVAVTAISGTITWQDAGGTAGNVLGGPTTLAANAYCGFMYITSLSKWLRYH